MKNENKKKNKSKQCDIHNVSNIATRVIRTQQGLTQFEVTLKEDDAIMYMLILKRNGIWFADVTR